MKKLIFGLAALLLVASFVFSVNDTTFAATKKKIVIKKTAITKTIKTKKTTKRVTKKTLKRVVKKPAKKAEAPAGRKAAVTLKEHIVEIISDSGEGAQKCGQSLGAIAAQMGNGIWTTEIIPAEIRPPADESIG